MNQTYLERVAGRNLPLRVKGVIVVAIPVCAMLAAMALLYQFERETRNAQDRVEHTYKVGSQIRQLLILMANAEAGMRGHIMTGHDSHLADYDAARAQVPAQLAALAQLLSDNPVHVGRVASLKSDVSGTLDSMERLHRDVASRRPTEADAEAETAGMARVRSQTAAMLEEEQRLLAERQQAERQAQLRLEIAVFFSGALGLLGGIAAALLFTTRIVKRVQHLEEDARKLALGMPIAEEVKGADEIASLGRAMQSASRLLAAQNEQLRGASAELEARVAQRTTELSAANAELREANEIRDAIVTSSPLAIWATDLEGLVIFWNPAAERIFGWNEAEVIGRPLPVVPEDSQPEFREWLERFRRGEKLVAVERTRRKKDGSRIDVSIWTAPLRDAAGNIRGSLAIDSDITARKLLEEQFRQSQKLEAVGRLAGGVAHDFNNLLTVIMGYVEMLREDARDAPQLLESVREIQYAAGRATALTAQLLAFSRRQVSQPKVIDLNEIVDHSTKLLSRVIGEDIEVAVHLVPKLHRIKADPTHIDQLLMNLVVNARDAMSQGGRLTIETASVVLDNDYAGRHIGVAPGPYAMLAVSDTGVGMTPEVKSRLFEPFFTTKESGKGTGLGLSIVYGIVKQNGGDIIVYSEPGQGTTFKIYFPAVDVSAEAPAGEARPIEMRGTETILVCEDESTIRKLIHTILGKQGYRVVEAESPGQALEIAHSNQEIRLLLTDIVMPQSSGFELARKFLELRPQLKVLYMSGYTDNQVGRTWVLDSKTPFLQKPFTAESLGQKVREALDRG